MILSPTLTTFIILLFGVITFVLTMFLPALLELKKPRDAGPRIITENSPTWKMWNQLSISIADMEENVLKQAFTGEITNVLSVLPNLET